MITAQDIADRAGVSTITVSRALRELETGKRRDARERAERIRQIAAEMGYRPNTAARSMSVGRFDAVALAFRQSKTTYLPTGFAAHLVDVATQHNLSLHLASIPDIQDDGSALPTVVREMVVDGLMIDELEQTDWLGNALKRYRIPAIWMNQKLDADCVYPDDRGLIRHQVERFMGLGHRRIALVTGRLGHFSVLERCESFREQMEHHGLRPQVLGSASTPELKQALLQTLSGPERCTAIITTRPGSAYSCLAMIHQLGFRVPDDVSIVLVGAHGSVELFGTGIDLVWFPGLPMAEALFTEFLAKRDAPDVPRSPVMVEFGPYTDNGSVARAPASNGSA